MECVSIEDPPRDVSRSFARVSLREEKEERRSSMLKDGRYEAILDSIEEDTADLTCRERIVRLLESMPFQCFMASCILLNAAVIGGETDFPELEIWKLVESSFLVLFLMELLLRLSAVGVKAFFAPGEDQIWNLFDFAIVGLGLFDVLCAKLGIQPGGHAPNPDDHSGEEKQHGGGGGASTLFRMIRLLRILRIFKIVRFLKQLYMLAFGFVEAIQAICWVSVLMFFLLYICSIVMVRTYGRPPEGNKDKSAEVLAEQFRSIMTSMLSLFELMSNPGNLAIYHVVMQDFPMLTVFLISFVIFGSFGMIALLTGVISESMFEKNQTRALEERQEREQKRELLKQKCLELYTTVDKDDNDEANPLDLEELVPYIREMFEKLDIEYMQHDFDNIIAMCDTDSSGSVSESEFVAGILSLCDGVRAASIQEVYYLVSQMNAKVNKFEELQDDVQALTKQTIPELQKELKKLMMRLDDPIPMLRDSSTPAREPTPAKTSTPQRDSALAKNSAVELDAAPAGPLEIHSSERPPSILSKDQTNGTTNGFDLSSLTQSTETLRLTLASTMDEQTKVITNKIDELKASFKDLYGNVFTVGEVEIGNKIKGDAEPSPVLPDLWQNKLNGTPGRTSHRDDAQRIRPLSPPPAIGSSRGMPARVEQRSVPLAPHGGVSTDRTSLRGVNSTTPPIR